MLAALVISLTLGQSQPEDWVVPPGTTWTIDGGEPEELADAGVEELDAGVRSVDGGTVAEQPAPDPRRFTWGHAALAVMGAVGSSGYFAVRVEGGAVYGWPRRMTGSMNRAIGPTVGLALDLLAAKLQVVLCGTAGVCGSRYQAGLAVRAAWNWGVIGNDGIVAPIHEVFLQVVPYLSSNSVPSAPLSPGSSWGEHGVRFDAGLISGFLRGSTWPKPGGFVIGGGLYAALSLEWMLVNSDVSGRFRGGLSLGVGI